MTSTRIDLRLSPGQAPHALSRRRIVMGGLTAAVASLAGCGGAALFAPFFTFLFVGVVDGLTISMSFNPEPASVDQPSGRFAPSSNITVNGVTFTFAGTFDRRDMVLAVVNATAPLASAYTGLFTDDDTVVLTTTEAGRSSITVRRQR